MRYYIILIVQLFLSSACAKSNSIGTELPDGLDEKAFTAQVVLNLEEQVNKETGPQWYIARSAQRVAWRSKDEQTSVQVRPVLNLIGNTEGTDIGDGYNETLAYGTYTNGDIFLTDMTLAEVDALQTRMLAHKRNHLNSSAVGRYQIVRTTLRTLKKRLELPDHTIFTSDLQDRLAIELMEQRGLSAWRDGSLDDASFALNLAKEWASLPKPHSCRGYYAGQRAAICFDELKSVLGQLRSF